MKNIFLPANFVFLILSGILYSCSDEEIPTLTTTEITNITTTSAVSGGNIISDGGAEITSRGVCWNTTGNPTIANGGTSDGTGTEPFESNLTLLLPNTNYSVRAYATNKAGTGYGNELSFITHNVITGSVNDIDGNTYKTVTIGTQTWMTENLKTTKFNDNTEIPLITGNIEWKSLISPGYCWYNNDSSTYKSDYGALYNWHTVANRKLCPTGWHVPTDDQWSKLITYLGGARIAGDKLKERGVAHWIRPNGGVTNESNFTALPGGGRIDGTFDNIGIACGWWTATAVDAENAWCLILSDTEVNVLFGYIGKSQGFSVRCIKDN